jgi:hypothetical protein
LGKEHNVSEFQGAAKIDKQGSTSPLVDRMNALLKVILNEDEKKIFVY